MRRLFLLFLIITLACLWATPVYAVTIGTVPSVIHGMVTLGHDTHTYQLGTTTIAADGELKVLSGVTLIFDPGSELNVFGKLTLRGTEKSHIILTASAGTFWEGIHSDCGSASEEIDYLEAQSMNSGIQVCSPDLNIHDVSIENSLKNTLTVGSSSQTLHYGAELSMSNLHFLTPLLGNAAQDIGIRFVGNFSKIVMNNVDFPRMNQIPEAIWPKLITIEGAFTSMGLGNGTVGGTCIINFTDYPQILGQLGVTPTTCAQAPVPVIFIPGYGTSYNLQALTDSSTIKSPVLTGWHFIHALTPQYDQLLSWFTANDVQYKVAYYDWRLSPDKIVESYLKPIIDQAKLEFHTSSVNIVAHSFGGIIARDYIQSDGYRGDVDTLLQLGAPNQGALKAYSVWEAGSLPLDWAPLTALILFYQAQHITQAPSFTDVIQQFFPSVQWLLPTYDALQRGGILVPESSLTLRNVGLDALNQSEELLTQRVHVITIASGDEDTSSLQPVDAIRGRAPWRDGKPVANAITAAGDGTVLLTSAEGIPGTHIRTTGSHMDLVENAASQVIAALYPEQNITAPDIPAEPTYSPENTMWIFADCPVTIEVTSPSGIIYDSTQAQSEPSLTFEQDDDMVWMGVPNEPGTFNFSITATADATVRWWVNTDSPRTVVMQAEQIITESYPPVVPISAPPATITSVPLPEVLTVPDSPVVINAPSSAPIVSIPIIAPLPWTNFQFQKVTATQVIASPAPIAEKHKKRISRPAPYSVRRLGTVLAFLICAVLLPP